VLAPERAVEIGLQDRQVVGIRDHRGERRIAVRHVPGFVRLDAQEHARRRLIAVRGGDLGHRDEDRVRVRGLGDDLEVQRALDRVADEEALERRATRAREEVRATELEALGEALGIGRVPREVAVEVHLLVHVTDLVEHLRHVALAELGVLDRVDQLAGAFHGRVLAEVHDRERDLHDLHPARLGLRRSVRARERVLERAVLAVVLLLFHREVVAQQVAERILRPRRDLVLRRVADRLLRVSRLPVEILDPIVRFDGVSHSACLLRSRPRRGCAPWRSTSSGVGVAAPSPQMGERRRFSPRDACRRVQSIRF
jgi:hypothetical protein